MDLGGDDPFRRKALTPGDVNETNGTIASDPRSRIIHIENTIDNVRPLPDTHNRVAMALSREILSLWNDGCGDVRQTDSSIRSLGRVDYMTK